MKLAILLLLVATLPAQASARAPSYVFDTLVLSAQPSGKGTVVQLANSRTVYCGPGGTLSRLCALLQPNDSVAFAGRFAADDSDLGSLGWFPVSTLTVEDSGPPPELYSGRWSFSGCITALQPNGAGRDVTFNVGQITDTAFCGPDGTLGSLCASLEVGDAALFSGAFPEPGGDLYELGLLDLKSVTVAAVAPSRAEIAVRRSSCP